jgi:hypothetical protein
MASGTSGFDPIMPMERSKPAPAPAVTAPSYAPPAPSAPKPVAKPTPPEDDLEIPAFIRKKML